VEIAIKVCRQAGYYKHALFLAEKHGQHEGYLKIQLEDLKDYNKALDYMAKLQFEIAEQNMKTYGKLMMEEVPEQTTEFLKRLCTGYDPPTGSPVRKTQKHAEAEEFIHIFVKNAQKLTEFLEHMIKIRPKCKSAVYNTLMEVYLRDYMHESNTLVKQKYSKRLMDLLQNTESGYDIDQALLLCCMNNFQPGILYLYQKAKLYQQVLKFHMDQKDYNSIINTCKRFGTYDPNLWVETLSYFSSIAHDDLRPYLTEVLDHVEKNKLLPPLMLVEMMAHSSTVTLAVLKDYLLRQLQQEQELIAEDERLIVQYQEETNKIKREIEDIKTSAQIFQVSKCSACSHPLELPSVHFLCGHSYHQHCFESYSEDDKECPVCLPENKKVLDIIRAQEHSKGLHEQFHSQLEQADDGFSVVAEYFGRGVFSKVTLVTDTPKERSLSTAGRPRPTPVNTTIVPPRARSSSPYRVTDQPQMPLVTDSGRPVTRPNIFSGATNTSKPLQISSKQASSASGSRHSDSPQITPILTGTSSVRPKAGSDYDSTLNPFEEGGKASNVIAGSMGIQIPSSHLLRDRPAVSASVPKGAGSSKNVYPEDLNPFDGPRKRAGADDYNKSLNPFE